MLKLEETTSCNTKAKSIVLQLVGLPGVGKTSVGRALCNQGWLWSDVDDEVEKSTGRSISELIRVEGEQHFRALESSVLAKALSEQSKAVLAGLISDSIISDSIKGAVISLGAGALVSESNLQIIHEARAKLELDDLLVVELAANSKTLANRVILDEENSDRVDPTRPVIFASKSIDRLAVETKIVKLLEERRSGYEIANIRVWTDFSEAVDIAQLLESISEFRLDSKLTNTKLILIPHRLSGEFSSSCIVIVKSLSEHSSSLIDSQLDNKRDGIKKCLVISDTNTTRISANLQWPNDKYEITKLSLPYGEETKSFSQLELILEKLAERKFTRSDIIVGVGGGVIGDISGLAASLYMRGVDCVHFPTSL